MNEENNIEEKAPATLGEKRIRVEFNPGNNDVVQNLKEDYAHMIDRLEKIRHEHTVENDSEFHRLIALAETTLEESAMWAVKAATFNK